MAYQPKYAQKGKEASKKHSWEAPQEPQPLPDVTEKETLLPQEPDLWDIASPEPEMPEEEQPKKRITLKTVLTVMIGCVVIPAACIATIILFQKMLFMVGRPNDTAQVKPIHGSIMENVEAHVTGALAEAGASLQNGREEPDAQKPTTGGEQPSQPTKEPEKERPLYVIEAGTQVAPEPNQECFGESTDLIELLGVIDQAQWLLDGADLYFDPKVELFEGSTVKYYLDDSIFAITWKEVHDGSVYTFSEVKVRHPSQFRRHLAGGVYGSDYQYKTTEMAESVNAVVASSGDFYRHRDFGAVVYEGEAKRVEGTYAETCYIDANGDMHFTYPEEVLTVQEVQAFVDEHDIQFSLAFGPILVDDHKVVEHTWYGVGEINDGYARAALCQMGPLHYLVATANTEGAYGDVPTVAQFQKIIAATGCKHAYSLDGGQTAAIVMNDQLINRPVYGEQRKISDIIYFATAVPEGG